MRAYEFIVEALTEKQKNWLYRQLGKKYDKNIHENIFKGKSRIYIPLESGGPTGPAPEAMTPTQQAIQAAIQPMGFVIADYKAGLAAKADDPKRQIKIGKLIKDQQLLNQFAKDPVRAATRQSDLVVVISRDAEDIGGMSTNRGWVSCMDLDGGGNHHYVPAEIKNGAIIAYLIKAEDTEINNPLARILMRPYLENNPFMKDKEKGMILVPDQVYGTAPKSFALLVKKFCSWANSGSRTDLYRLAKGSYNDNRSDTEFHMSPGTDISTLNSYQKEHLAINDTTDPEILLQLLNDPESDDLKEFIAQNANLPVEIIDKFARDPKVKPEILERVVLNDAVSDKTLLYISTLSPTKYIKAFKQMAELDRKLPAEILTNLMAQYKSNFDLYSILCERTDLPLEYAKELWGYAVKKNDQHELWKLAHYNQNPEFLRMAFNAASKWTATKWEIELALSKNPYIPADIASALSKHQESEVRHMVASYSKNIPLEDLIALASDSSPLVRRGAINQNRIPVDVLRKLLKTERVKDNITMINRSIERQEEAAAGR